MRILVTNDDGVDHPGLHGSADALRAAGHEVLVVAPSGERSGSSSSLGSVVDGTVIEVAAHGVEGTVLAVEGPPALIVRAACTRAFGPVPDLVVAGVNPGANTGRRVLHSGTVGAAVTAAAHDVPGLALSAPGPDGPGIATAATLAVWVAAAVVDLGRPPLALSVNVPDRSLEDLAGIGSAWLSGTSLQEVSFDATPGGLRVRRGRVEPPYSPGSDADLVHRGCAAVTDVVVPWASAPPIPDHADRIAGALRRRWRPDGRPPALSGVQW